jgi:hypothetical protein
MLTYAPSVGTEIPVPKHPTTIPHPIEIGLVSRDAAFVR